MMEGWEQVKDLKLVRVNGIPLRVRVWSEIGDLKVFAIFRSERAEFVVKDGRVIPDRQVSPEFTEVVRDFVVMHEMERARLRKVPLNARAWFEDGRIKVYAIYGNEKAEFTVEGRRIVPDRQISPNFMKVMEEFVRKGGDV